VGAISHEGKPLRMLTVIDEFTRECLAIRVVRRLTAENAHECLTELFCSRGIPEYIRSDNGPEFTCHRIRRWLSDLGTHTLFIEPGSPWENGYIESFNGRLRDEPLKREIFWTLEEARVLIERWRQMYNRRRPHSSLGNRPPAPEAYLVPKWGSPLTVAAAFGLTLNLVQRMGAGQLPLGASASTARLPTGAGV
jgi:putative transposase